MSIKEKPLKLIEIAFKNLSEYVDVLLWNFQSLLKQFNSKFMAL